MAATSTDPMDAQRRWLTYRRSNDQDPTLQVGIAASFTAEPLEPFLGAALLEMDTRPAIRFADYNQIHQTSFAPETMLGQIDVAVVLWRIEDVFGAALKHLLEGADGSASEVVDGVAELGRSLGNWARLADYPIVVGLPPVPAPIGVDLLDSATTIDLLRIHGAATSGFLAAMQDAPVRVVDLVAWERFGGGAAVFDWVKWVAYKQPFTTSYWNLIGQNLADVIAREKQPPPKCIVLDADNTLWGGILGEDGVGGIELSSAFPGIAFQEFQRVLKRLRAKGVLLAVASKNNHADVIEVFTSHDDMLLSVDDIAVWRVNWGPKSHSIREIASELNIGLDAVVFVDDSDYELAEVRAALPEVRTLQVPSEIADLPHLLAESGLFRNMKVSDEDLKRTEMILSEQARKEQGSTLSREEFLQSLQLVVEYFPVADEHIGRVAQLTNKTNQFNLTTIRRTEAEMRAVAASDRHLVRAIRVSDKFGDYGLVGVAILEQRSSEWEIETLLLSCRVLGRGVETAFISQLAEDVHRSGGQTVVGRYVATPKNAMVANLYIDHGFVAAPDGTFVAATVDVLPAPAHITFG